MFFKRTLHLYLLVCFSLEKSLFLRCRVTKRVTKKVNNSMPLSPFKDFWRVSNCQK